MDIYDNQGININKLKPGTKIKVKTTNHFYEFKITGEPCRVLAKGGKYIN